MTTAPRKRVVYVKAQPSKGEQLRSWVQSFWPVILAFGAIAYALIGEISEWGEIKRLVGHIDPPSGLVKRVSDLDRKADEVLKLVREIKADEPARRKRH